MKPFLHLSTLLFLTFFCPSILAQSLVLSNPDQTYPLFDYVTTLETQPGQLTIDSLVNHPDKYSFIPIKQRFGPFKEDRNYWFKVDLKNPTPDNYFLRFFYLGDMLVRVYKVDKNRIIGSWQADLNGFSSPDLFQRSRSILPLRLQQGQTLTLYFFVPKMAIPRLHLGVMSSQRLTKEIHYQDLLHGLFYGFIFIIAIYSLLLGIRLNDRDNLLYSLWIVTSALGLSSSSGALFELPGSWLMALRHNYGVYTAIISLIQVQFAISFLQLRQRVRWLYWLGTGLSVVIVIAIVGVVYSIYLSGQNSQMLQPYLATLSLLFGIIFGILGGIIVSIKGYRPGLFYTFGSISILIFTSLFVLSFFNVIPFTFWNQNSAFIGLIVEIIFYLFGLTYKIDQLKKNQDKAIQEQLRLLETNQQLIETQKETLEAQVSERTAQLRASQAQLIQKEKLASLGELTAGIAHEIQNPLNFVNNFSEVSTELVEELEEEVDAGRIGEIKAIARDLHQNLQKITHHGRRASSIVKGMLEHSRTSTGDKRPVDLNVLAGEYLKLAYQGLRAKDTTFNCELVTEFDSALTPIEIMPQEIGRVLLNLYNNAFYAVHLKQKTAPAGYQPTVMVSTHQLANAVEIRVRDNGTGIPDAVKAKIFQPFFTTKPTGEGTGLGLSLSYDIITKGHGGELVVESHQGTGTEFIVKLPA